MRHWFVQPPREYHHVREGALQPAARNKASSLSCSTRVSGHRAGSGVINAIVKGVLGKHGDFLLFENEWVGDVSDKCNCSSWW
jgi:hypothetical protein